MAIMEQGGDMGTKESEMDCKLFLFQRLFLPCHFLCNVEHFLVANQTHIIVAHTNLKINHSHPLLILLVKFSVVGKQQCRFLTSLDCLFLNLNTRLSKSHHSSRSVACFNLSALIFYNLRLAANYIPVRTFTVILSSTKPTLAPT